MELSEADVDRIADAVMLRVKGANPGFVPEDVCQARYGAVGERVESVTAILEWVRKLSLLEAIGVMATLLSVLILLLRGGA